jgi:surfeit locus 1 family protein
MRVSFGQRVFEPRGWALLVTIPLLAALVALGFWQIDRAREKQALLNEFAAGTETVPLADGQRIEELPRYQRLSIRGRYDGSRQILLDNMPSAAGSPGYRVLTPLRRADGGGIVLVDRGWVPLGQSRADLPAVDVSGGERVVSGRLDGLPVPGLRVGAASASPGSGRWPRVLNFPVSADLETELGEPVAERIVLLDDDRPDGYERAWRPAGGFGPTRHLGYAIQWFALALTLIVIFVALNLRRVTDMTDEVQDA